MKKNILYIVHQWLDYTKYNSTAVGGTTLHVLDIIHRIKEENNCFILYAQNKEYMLGIYTEEETKIYRLKTKVKISNFDGEDSQYAKMLNQILEEFQINMVHIHHLINHPYDIIKVLKQRQIPTIVTLHDFFLICPRVNLLYKNQDYCDVKNIKKCEKCLGKEYCLQERIRIVTELFQFVKVIIVPNKTVYEIFRRFYPKANYKTIEHGTDLKQQLPVITNNSKLNIAFVGCLTYLKGSDIAKIVVQNMDTKEYKFHLFGISDDPFFTQNTINYLYHGEYQRENLAKLLRKYKIDVVCLLTRCPETYCYTLSEVLSAGIPVVGFDIGAVGERIKRLRVGWTVPIKERETGVIQKLKEIKDHPSEYKKVLQAFEHLQLQTIDQMVKETLNEYQYKEAKNNGSIKKRRLIMEEVSILYYKESKIVQVFKQIKKYIPYKVKRPIYLIIQKIKKK